MLGDAGERGQHRKRVRPADHVLVEDLPQPLAQDQTLSEEEEIELAAFRGLRQMAKRGEVDLASGRRVRPQRLVIDAPEVGTQDDLPGVLTHEHSPFQAAA